LDKQNVVVILSDTLRWDALGVNGGPGWLDVKTPELDAFARESSCFDGARVSSFPTIPMRTDCFSGKFSHPRYGWQALDPSLKTLPQLFQSAGYTTQLLADTTHLLRSGLWRPFRHFDFLRGHEGDAPLSRLNEPPPKTVTDRRKTRIDLNRDPEDPAGAEIHAQQNDWWRYEGDRLCSRTSEKVCEWLEGNWRGGPFFLWVDFFDVHEPWDPPEYLWRMYQPEYEGEPMIQPNYGSMDAYAPQELANMRARYAGEVTLISKVIGRILRTMEDMGLMEKTIVTLLSDHGTFVGDQGRTGKSLIAPDRFDAFPQYSQIARLVWMIKAPGFEHRRFEDIVQPPDLMPTLLDLCGLGVPGDVEGRSLLPLMEERGESERRLAISTWTMPTHFSKELVFCRRPTVTDGEWTLVIQEPPDPEPPELYHTKTDPKEREDVINENVDQAKRLHREMLAWLQGMGTPPEAIDRLKQIEWPS
jgi:arylsulfatase A-like enzyme